MDKHVSCESKQTYRIYMKKMLVFMTSIKVFEGKSAIGVDLLIGIPGTELPTNIL
jgi:hypothetical protein